ncbi:MAG: hypothetical protein IJ524_05060 [Bacteroidales bacterium]|nr:hypothetical protein [Bacteroidales bacterium]
MFGKGITIGKIQGFSPLLDENVVQIIYDEKYFNQFKGKLQVIQYWNNWIKKQAEQEHTHKYSIVCAKYFSSEAVQIDYYNKEKRFNGSMLVVFSFNEQEKIQRILFTRDYIYYTHFKEEKYSPLVTLESLTPNLIGLEFKKSNHLPCMRCGKESSELIWLGYRRIAYGGNISFCPTCGEEVESYCHIHYYVDYEHDYFPINDNIDYIEKRLSDETSAIEAISPIVLGTRGMVFEEPYMEVLAKIDKSITGTKIDRLSYAAEHGIYEAYNNLGIEMLGNDDDKAIEYFKLGVEHGVATSMLNLSLWYYGHKDYPNFEYYSKLAAEANSLVGMYNHATNLAWPSSKEPMIYEATSLLIRTVEKCLEQELKHNMNQNVDDDSWTMVQHWSYYALAYIYYKEYGSYQDLLKAYAYLNECKTQTDIVRDLKACIYEDLQEMKEKMKVPQDYDDLPF